MANAHFNPQFDAYIAKAQPFAQPILVHLRNLVHEACPEIEESIKWSRPFFIYRGEIFGYMAAFKRHCTFGFWGQEMAALPQTGTMSDFSRITSVEALSGHQHLLDCFRQAAALIASGKHTSPVAARSKTTKVPKPVLAAPSEFTDALKKDKKASTAFAAFSPSCQREYLKWIAEAKRIETRDRRIAQAIAQIADGKQRDWKYQNC